MSESTKLLLEQSGDEFELDLRGEIDVKGKGKMTTYWLKGMIKQKNNNNSDDMQHCNTSTRSGFELECIETLDRSLPDESPLIPSSISLVEKDHSIDKTSMIIVNPIVHEANNVKNSVRIS